MKIIVQILTSTFFIGNNYHIYSSHFAIKINYISRIEKMNHYVARIVIV